MGYIGGDGRLICARSLGQEQEQLTARVPNVLCIRLIRRPLRSRSAVRGLFRTGLANSVPSALA